MGKGGKRSSTPLYRGVRKVILRGRRGGQEKFDGLYPSLFWVLNFCKNCMTFGDANIFTTDYSTCNTVNQTPIYNNATWSITKGLALHIENRMSIYI